MRHLPHVHISVVSIGAVVTLIGTFMTWVRSGEAGRSSYEIFDIVERLGFSPDGAVGWALRIWPLVPLLLAVSVVVWWLPPPSHVLLIARAVVASAAALYAALVAVAVMSAPEIALFSRGPGPPVTLIGAFVILVGVAWAVLVHRPAPTAPATHAGAGSDRVNPR